MVYLSSKVESGNRKRSLKRREKRRMGRELRDRLKEVDPNLTIISGGVRQRRKSTEKDWAAAAGPKCPRCGEESLRFRPEDGVCRKCAGELDEKEERDKKKRAKWLRQVKAHNARIDNRKKGGS
jgi:hypothetical protein